MKIVSNWGFPFDNVDLRVCVRTMLNIQGMGARSNGQEGSNDPPWNPGITLNTIVIIMHH